MTFDEWLEHNQAALRAAHGGQMGGCPNEAEEFARMAWDAAIEAAAKVCDDTDDLGEWGAAANACHRGVMALKTES